MFDGKYNDALYEFVSLFNHEGLKFRIEGPLFLSHGFDIRLKLKGMLDTLGIKTLTKFNK